MSRSRHALIALGLALGAVGLGLGLGLMGERAWAAEPPLALRPQTPSEEVFVFRLETSRTFTGGGGPLLMGLLFDLDGLNAALHGILDLEGAFTLGERSVLWASGIFGFGGSTFRFGGFSAGRGWSFPVREGAGTPFTQARLGVVLAGLLAERLAAEEAWGGLSLGLLAGRGRWTLRLVQSVRGDFDALLDDPPRYVQLERGFWFALPYVSVESAFFEFLGIKALGGVGLTLSLEDWELPDGLPVPGGPLGTVVLPFVQLMLVFGG